MADDTKTYNTYVIPFNASSGFPQTIRLTISKWVFDFTWSYNMVSKMPILTVKSTTGKTYIVAQLVPFFALYTQDSVTGEPFMTIITKNVNLNNISAYIAMNHTWSGAMAEKSD